MEYITAVVNESLRIRSPASIFLREVGTEDQLGEYKIPKGAVVIIPICVLHRSEENWKNHDKFIPERFLGMFCIICLQLWLFYIPRKVSRYVLYNLFATMAILHSAEGF